MGVASQKSYTLIQIDDTGKKEKVEKSGSEVKVKVETSGKQVANVAQQCQTSGERGKPVGNVAKTGLA